MTLVKTSFWSSLSVIIKIITIFISSKVVAVFTGPVGLALIEQFQNFIQIVRSISSSMSSQGVVKYTAEYREDADKKSRILSSAFFSAFIISFLLGIVIFYFSHEIAVSILKSEKYKTIMQFFAGSILLFSWNNLFWGLLTGQLEIRKYVTCNIVNSLLMFIITLFLVMKYGLYGGLFALLFNQTVVVFFTIYILNRCPWFSWKSLLKGVDRESLHKLSLFVCIGVLTTASASISQLIVRNYLGYALSWEEAGYWQGMIKFSNNLFIVIDSILGVYFLPKFSSLIKAHDIKHEIMQSYKILIPGMICIALFVFSIKKYVILILYSPEFLPMMNLFKYQLIGDIAKIGAWLLTYVMISKTRVQALLISECFFILVSVALTIVCVSFWGLIGSTIGYAVSYILYWMLLLGLNRRYVFVRA